MLNAYLYKSSEDPMMFFRGIFICVFCFFNSIKITKMNFFFVDSNSGLIFGIVTKAIKSYSFYAAFWAPFCSVSVVLCARCFSEICNSIVTFIKIDMINFISRPLPRNIKPRQSMGSISPSIYSNVPIPVCRQTPGYFSSPESVSSFGHVRTIFPNEYSSLAVIVKNRANILGCNIVARAIFLYYFIISHIVPKYGYRLGVLDARQRSSTPILILKGMLI